MVLLLDAHRRAYNGSQQACKKIVKLLGVANVKSFFQQEYTSDDRLTLMVHQQVQKCLAAGGGGVPSTEARRMPTSIWSRVGVILEVPADLTVPSRSGGWWIAL